MREDRDDVDLLLGTAVNTGSASGTSAPVKNDASYRRPENDAYRKRRPFGYAPRPAPKPARRRSR